MNDAATRCQVTLPIQLQRAIIKDRGFEYASHGAYALGLLRCAASHDPISDMYTWLQQSTTRRLEMRKGFTS